MWLRHEGRSRALLRSSKADLPQHSSRERVVCGGSLRTKPPIDLMPTNGSLKLFCPNQTRGAPRTAHGTLWESYIVGFHSFNHPSVVCRDM